MELIKNTSIQRPLLSQVSLHKHVINRDRSRPIDRLKRISTSEHLSVGSRCSQLAKEKKKKMRKEMLGSIDDSRVLGEIN